MKPTDRSSLEHIRRDAQRMQRARARRTYSPLRGLGAFGAVGWSVAIPTVGGALLGIWLDRLAPQPFPWTLALILGGLAIGVIVAWDWIARENRRALDEQEAGARQEAARD